MIAHRSALIGGRRRAVDAIRQDIARLSRVVDLREVMVDFCAGQYRGRRAIAAAHEGDIAEVVEDESLRQAQHRPLIPLADQVARWVVSERRGLAVGLYD